MLFFTILCFPEVSIVLQIPSVYAQGQKSNVYEFWYETAPKEGVNSRMTQYCKPVPAKLFLILCNKMYLLAAAKWDE